MQKKKKRKRDDNNTDTCHVDSQCNYLLQGWIYKLPLLYQFKIVIIIYQIILSENYFTKIGISNINTNKTIKVALKAKDCFKCTL